ncbi:hypothetical protein FHG87_022483 [Trinorchestia longiramus]|nr:hypothetical protein FHG87_022483 [Trinorchestia longiramus]
MSTETAEVIDKSIANIFTRSHETGIVSEHKMQANVASIFKKRNKQTPYNYRPISLTAIISGLLGGLLGGSEGSGQNPLTVVNGLVKCLVGGLGVENVIDLVLNLAVTAGIPINFEAISALLEQAAKLQANVSVGAGSSPVGGTGSTTGGSSPIGGISTMGSFGG